MIVILGGGPAGRLAAVRLATAGKEVKLIEKGGIGGQCLHFGCMPVCAMSDVARHLQTAGTFRELGITGPAPEVNFPALLREMQKIQATIAAVLDKETRDAGVDIIYGREGRFDGSRVALGDEEMDADAVILSTGSRPNIPAIPGMTSRGVYTPHTLHTMEGVPEKLAIIGGGIIAAEFAYIFSRFGSKVTIFSRGRFLKNLDEHLRKRAIRELSGSDLREGTDVLSVEEERGSLRLRLKGAGGACTMDCDAVLLAAGLIPNSECLDGIRKRPNGEVIVDDYMRTSLPGIYACGDVTGPPFLTPVARQQGIVAADNILGKHRKMRYDYIPQSLSLGYDLAFCWDGNPDAKPLILPGPAGPGTFWEVPGSNTGLAKIMVAPDGSLSGICTASPGGGLIAGYMAILMKHHFSVHDFEDFIEVHPSTDGIYGLAKYASEILRKRG
jgi:dihydrolipoamide dehydrogenase